MNRTTQLSSDLIGTIRWPAVMVAAVAGLTPHILLLYSPAMVRLTVIVVIHALIVPVFVWFGLWRLEKRARGLETANDTLRQTADDLSRRNRQIDALNWAFRLLSGARTIPVVLQPLAELIRQVGQARWASIVWNDSAGEGLKVSAGDFGPLGDNPECKACEFELVDAAVSLGSVRLGRAGNDEFTQKSLAVLASEIGLRWRLRQIEGHAISDLTGSLDGEPEPGSDRQSAQLLAAIADALQASGAGLYVLRDGKWQRRVEYGDFDDVDLVVPHAADTDWWHEQHKVVFLKGATDCVLVLHGIELNQRARDLLNLPLLRMVAGHNATLLRANDRFREMIWLERRRIAGELHDDVCQSLASLRMQFGHLADLIAAGRSTEAAMRCDELRDDVSDAYDTTRRAIDGYRQKPAPDERAADFLERVARMSCARCGAMCEMTAGDIELSAETAWQLGRVVQEAIGNAVRHGAARLIRVSLNAEGEQVTLEVSDDGLGLDANPPGSGARSHHGIAIMKERVSALNGHLDLSREDDMTILHVTVPARGF